MAGLSGPHGARGMVGFCFLVTFKQVQSPQLSDIPSLVGSHHLQDSSVPSRVQAYPVGLGLDEENVDQHSRPQFRSGVALSVVKLLTEGYRFRSLAWK